MTKSARTPMKRLAALVFLSSACAPHGPTPLAARLPSGSPSTICPFGVRGVRVETRDTKDGIDVALSAFGCDLADLRERAHVVLGGAVASDAATKALAKPKPLSVANHLDLEDVPSGIVVHVHAVDLRNAGEARREVRSRIDSATDENCP